MSEERYVIIFQQSDRGNTRKLADTIRGQLPDAELKVLGEAKLRSGCRDDLCGFLDGQGHGGSGVPGTVFGQASGTKRFSRLAPQLRRR